MCVCVCVCAYMLLIIIIIIIIITRRQVINPFNEWTQNSAEVVNTVASVGQW